MNIKDLILIGALAVGGYFIYKMLTGGTPSIGGGGIPSLNGDTKGGITETQPNLKNIYFQAQAQQHKIMYYPLTAPELNVPVGSQITWNVNIPISQKVVPSTAPYQPRVKTTFLQKPTAIPRIVKEIPALSSFVAQAQKTLYEKKFGGLTVKL